MKKTAIILTSMLLVASFVSARTVVNIDLTHSAATGPTGHSLSGVAGDQTSATWNAVTDTTEYTGLVDEDGNVTSTSFQLGTDPSGDAISFSADDGSAFFFGYVYFGNKSIVVQNSFTIGGLDDNKTYDLYFYATWGYADAGSQFSVDGGSNWKTSDGIPSEWTAGFTEGDSYVKFENVVSSGNEIDGMWRSFAQTSGPDAGKHRGMFNAVQVVEVIPEPSSYALLSGLLALACIMLRRRC